MARVGVIEEKDWKDCGPDMAPPQREADVPSAVGAIVHQAERLEHEVERLSGRIASVCSQHPDRDRKTDGPGGPQKTTLGADLAGIAERLERSVFSLADVTDSIEV